MGSSWKQKLKRKKKEKNELKNGRETKSNF